MQKNQQRAERGYSLPEMLTIVAIVGMIAVVGIPAFVTLMPTYKVRSAASEIAATVRMARQNALSTRRPWRITFDNAGERYALSELSSPNADMKVAANWTAMGENNRPLPTGAQWWKTLPTGIDMSTINLLDVDCSSGTDLIFLRDGSVSTLFNTGCGPGGSAALTLPAAVRIHYNSTLVTYNTYYVGIGTQSGWLTTRQTKE